MNNNDVSFMTINTRNFSTIINILLQKTDTLLILLDSNFNIQFIDSKLQALYGWCNSSIIHENYLEKCRESQIDCVLTEEMIQQIKAGNLIMDETNQTIQSPQGRPMVIEWKLYSISDQQSASSEILLLGIDLKSNFKKDVYLYPIINNVPCYIFWKNRHSIFLGCNNLFAKTAGLNNSEDIVGKTDYDLPWSEAESDAYRADDQEVIMNNCPKLNIEETQTFPNGESIVLLTNKVPLHNDLGEVIGVLAVYSDITAIKKNEVALQKTKGQLEGMTILGASIAHELRTPLASMRSVTDMLAKYLPQLIAGYQSDQQEFSHKPVLRESRIDLLSAAPEKLTARIQQANIFHRYVAHQSFISGY